MYNILSNKTNCWTSVKDPVLSSTLCHLTTTQGILNSPVTSASLEKLGLKLENSSTDRSNNNHFVFVLTDAIQQQLNVTRFYVSGSYGRRSSIGSVNADIVAFLLANQLLPYDKEASALDIADTMTTACHHLLRRLHNFLSQRVPSLTKLCFGDRVRVLPLEQTLQQEKLLNLSPCIRVTIGTSTFRIFLAPSLGRTGEEQRQASYRCMQAVYQYFGHLDSLSLWHPSLIERSSEEMASSHTLILSFIRVCCLWAQLLPESITSTLRIYAIETLAYIIAKKHWSHNNNTVSTIPLVDSSLCQNQEKYDGERNKNNSCSSSKFNFYHAFRLFLKYCSDLSKVSSLCEIESPATYISPWNHYKGILLTDNFNPYDNLLLSLSESDVRKIEAIAQDSLEYLDTNNNSRITLFDFFSRISQKRKRTAVNNTSVKLISIIIIMAAAIYLGTMVQTSDWKHGIEKMNSLHFYKTSKLTMKRYYIWLSTLLVQIYKRLVASSWLQTIITFYYSTWK